MKETRSKSTELLMGQRELGYSPYSVIRDAHLCWSAMTMGMRVYTAVSLSVDKNQSERTWVKNQTSEKETCGL